MKKSIYAGAAFFLIVTSSFPSAWGSENKDNFKVSYIGNGVAFPSTVGFPGATHEFQIHVQGQSLSELAIDLPDGVSINKGIEIQNQSGKKIDAQVSVNNQTATVIFSQPVEPQTTLLVKLQGVNTSFRNHVWLYLVYGKMPNLTAQIPLGTARIQTSGR